MENKPCGVIFASTHNEIFSYNDIERQRSTLETGSVDLVFFATNSSPGEEDQSIHYRMELLNGDIFRASRLPDPKFIHSG